MNLRSLANGATRAVRPNRTVTWQRSTGWTQDPDTAQRMATYQTINLPAQIQAVSSTDLQLLNGLNIQGYHRCLYINGRALGAVRNQMKGGDIFLFDGQEWKVTLVPEDWDDCGWSRVIVTLQQESGSGADR